MLSSRLESDATLIRLLIAQPFSCTMLVLVVHIICHRLHIELEDLTLVVIATAMVGNLRKAYLKANMLILDLYARELVEPFQELIHNPWSDCSAYSMAICQFFIFPHLMELALWYGSVSDAEGARWL
ncbi:LOW QUALITY PROTEIN: hypothetical protein NC652_004863 [Populus alba x Populus x berolinensis]|nr:LOW QUALITY PROTEIN: hypothetical protein NC652_004863 [Populus alba x Populus x berolinensis]